jgi:hypothetical protein
VLAQTPAAGQNAKKGSLVALLVAVGSSTSQVPSIVGMNSSQADQALRSKNLSLGTGSPQPVDPAAKIASQIPAAGQVVKQGTPVNFFFKKPAPPDKVNAKTAAAKDQAKKSAAQAAKGGAVPALAAGATAASVAGAVAKNGIVPVEVQAFSPAKKGTVFKTVPASGTKLKAGDKLTLFVSAGFPQLAFDNGQKLLLVDGFSGKKLPAPVQGPSTNTDPTWSPDASHLMYSSNGRLFLKDLTKPKSTAIPLTSAGDTFEDPSWAPTGDANVIAMDQVKGSGANADRDLCLAALAGTGMTVKCKAEPNVRIGRAIHWAPNGKSLLAFGQTTDGSKQGIVRWRTQKAFSPNPDDWSAGHFVTDVTNQFKGAVDAAISPDGKQLAVAANFGADFFRLYLTKPGDFALSAARATPIRACKIAWRGDSKELVVQASGGGCNDDGSTDTGQLTGVSLPNLRSTPLAVNGDNPAFQPLTLGG